MKRSGLSIYMFFLKLLMLIFIIKEFFTSNYKIAILFSFILIFFIFSYFFKKKLNLKYIYFFENLVYLLVFTYEFNLFYENIPYWDTGMHAFTGFIATVFILILFKIRKKKGYLKKLSPFLIAFLGFCFSMTVGLVFELYEYTIDKTFTRDMQKDMLLNHIETTKFSEDKKDLIKIKNIQETIIYYLENDTLKEFTIKNGYLDIGNNDTMKDLYVNLLGSLMGYFYVYFILKKNMLEK